MENKVITWDDDNHGTKVYINGKYVGNLDHPEIAMRIAMCAQELKGEFKQTDVYIFDIENEDETITNDEMDKICELFDESLTETQQNLIFARNWKGLVETI